MNLWVLQIIKGKEFEQRAVSNCIRLLVEEAPRGEIYDQQGHILVTNRPSVNFSIIPAEISNYQTLSDKLSPVIALDSPTILSKLKNHRQSPFQALTIKRT